MSRRIPAGNQPDERDQDEGEPGRPATDSQHVGAGGLELRHHWRVVLLGAGTAAESLAWPDGPAFAVLTIVGSTPWSAW